MLLQYRHTGWPTGAENVISLCNNNTTTMKHLANAGLMLIHRMRRWPNIKQASDHNWLLLRLQLCWLGTPQGRTVVIIPTTLRRCLDSLRTLSTHYYIYI